MRDTTQQLGLATPRLKPRTRGHVPATSKRSFHDMMGHASPSGRRRGRKRDLNLEPRRPGRYDTFDGRWPGTSKEHEPARRKRRNRLSWRNLVAGERRQAIARRRAMAEISTI